MASVAGRWEFRACVIGVGGLLIVLQMAGGALRGKSLELANRGALVAFIALDSGVGAEEREAVLVILHLLNGCVPAADRMALSAVRTELAAMNICVAIGTCFADVREDRLDVALRAANLFVHAAQGIRGLVVVELHVAANRSPTVRCVAIFARHCQRAVGATRAFFLPVSGQCE